MICCDEFDNCTLAPGCIACRETPPRREVPRTNLNVVKRPCDGQPNRMCPNDCDVDCSFNNATLDRVMNYPLRRVHCHELPQPTAPAENLPYDWFTTPAWVPPVVISGALGAIAFGLYRYFF